MTIIIGSKNPTKVKAVQEVFNNQVVCAEDVPSKVSNQPLSDEETLIGAYNRAEQAIQLYNAEIGIGLEGGVMELQGVTYLCSWGSMIDKNGVQFNASGARIPLPIEIAEGLHQDKELGDLMDLYAQKQDVRKNEGAIGIFTNNLIGRKEMFVHILKLMKGQSEIYYKNKS